MAARAVSDGGWVSILQKQGISVSPLRPANCGFTVTWSNIFRQKFSGQPLKSVALTDRKHSPVRL
jgi:hypothetical protein